MDQYVEEKIQGRVHEMKVFAIFATLAVLLLAGLAASMLPTISASCVGPASILRDE